MRMETEMRMERGMERGMETVRGVVQSTFVRTSTLRQDGRVQVDGITYNTIWGDLYLEMEWMVGWMGGASGYGTLSGWVGRCKYVWGHPAPALWIESLCSLCEQHRQARQLYIIERYSQLSYFRLNAESVWMNDWKTRGLVALRRITKHRYGDR
jgi:hypothetical protein